jgi:hypothetical protein
MLSIKKWSLQIVECPIVEMQFYFSGGAIEADNKGVARTKALNIIPSTGQPGFLYLSFLPMASTASHLPSLAGRPHLDTQHSEITILRLELFSAGGFYSPALGYSNAGGPPWAQPPVTRRVSELERPQCNCPALGPLLYGDAP